VQDTVNPFTLLNVAFNSGLDQDDDSEKRFGQGMEGFARREGANEASDATGRFFSEFLFPTVLSEDARYYRLGRGGGGRRLLHAFKHAFVAHSDDGSPMPNISEWAGTTSGVLLSDVYHPGTTHGPGSRRLTALAKFNDGCKTLDRYSMLTHVRGEFDKCDVVVFGGEAAERPADDIAANERVQRRTHPEPGR
jgi:hypothetical protein